MKDIELKQADSTKDIPTLSWKKLPPTKSWRFVLEDEPEMLYITKLNAENRYAVFYEDAYEMEPWQTGIKVMSKEEIETLYKITLD